MVIASTPSLGHFHGSNVDPFGQTIRSRSNSSAHRLFGTSTPFGSPTSGSDFSEKKSSSYGSTSGFPGTTKFGGIASTTGNGKQCQGSAVASYSATLEVDGIGSRYSAGKIKSISAMPVYKDKSHEELRLEDYELPKGFTFSIQNERNAFQLSNSLFGPSSIPVPSSQSSFGSHSGLAFGTVTAARVSDSSVKPPFSSTSTAIGVSPSFRFGGSIGDGNVDRDPRNSASGASSTKIFSAPNNTGVGFKSTPPVLHSNSVHGSTSSTFGVSSMPPFASASASSGFKPSIFGFPSTSVLEGSSISAFQVSTTPGFGIKSTPSSWSTSASVGSILSGPKSTCDIAAPSTSNISVTTTSGFRFSSTSAFGNSSIFGIQTSSGSQGTTTIESTVSNQCQGSGVASYSATREVDRANNRYSVEKVQSISAMPIYKDKSHEELRSEDYAICNKGGQTLLGGQILGSSCFKTSDTSPNIFHSAPLSNQPSVNSPFQPFRSNLSAPKSENFINPNNTISKAPTISPSVNPFSRTNLYPSKSQASIPQPTVASSMPAFTPNLNPSSLIPFSESMLAKSFQCPRISTTFSSPSVRTFSSSRPSVTVSPSIHSTSVTTALDPRPSILNASQPRQTAENVNSLSTNDLSQPSQASNGLTPVKEFSSQIVNGQQYVPSSTLDMQSSLVANPFATGSPIDQPNAVTSRQYGISSLPISNNLSSNRRTSLLRIRHVSFTHPWLPAQRSSGGSSETKVPFFIDVEDRPGPIAPFLPRENPRAWVKNSLSLRSHSDGKGHEDKDCYSSSVQLNENSTGLTDDTSIQEEDLSVILNWHQGCVAAVTEKHEADVLALMPKLPGGEYYTEPSLKELAAKEMAEPGYCGCVNDFVVGRWGYGSIKFLGETDVRHLDLESIVQFNNREVIVYPDDRKKPPVGQSLNKPAEVTLLNVKCISKKTGKQYVEGLQLQVHSFKEMLIKKTSEQGAEFVSYDPVPGEWKFRVPHF